MERKSNKQPKLGIRKGDKVRVIAGDDKGKEGTILEVLLDKNRAVVEGVNIVTKHTKPSAGKPEGG
jgi:large subunit ribosomal protein L24